VQASSEIISPLDQLFMQRMTHIMRKTQHGSQEGREPTQIIRVDLYLFFITFVAENTISSEREVEK